MHYVKLLQMLEIVWFIPPNCKNANDFATNVISTVVSYKANWIWLPPAFFDWYITLSDRSRIWSNVVLWSPNSSKNTVAPTLAVHCGSITNVCPSLLIVKGIAMRSRTFSVISCAVVVAISLSILRLLMRMTNSSPPIRATVSMLHELGLNANRKLNFLTGATKHRNECVKRKLIGFLIH